MANPRAPIKLPTSYNTHPFTQIKTEHYEKDPSIIILTLYRPKNNNAFTNTMMLELEEAYGMFDVDDRVRVIVVTGHGRIFCAGADLEIGFQKTDEPSNEHRDGYVIFCFLEERSASSYIPLHKQSDKGQGKSDRDSKQKC
jgi:1,4-dihydroxy-2-naphthoyl-CoA synthase